MAINLDLTQDLNKVRVIIGDAESPYILSDSIIEFILDEENDNVNKAAIRALSYIISSLTKKIDQEVGDVKVNYSQLLDNYKQLYKDLTGDPARSLNAVLHKFGGTSKQEIDRVKNNSDTPKSPIGIGFSTDLEDQKRVDGYLFLR